MNMYFLGAAIWTSSEHVLPDFPETTVNTELSKSTTILTTKCMAPRNKEEHYPEVSGLTLLSEISVIECQLSSKER